MSRKASQAFGLENADKLAALAIDLLCDSPERISTCRTTVRARLVEEGRELLDELGIGWREIVREQELRRREAAAAARESVIFSDVDRSHVGHE